MVIAMQRKLRILVVEDEPAIRTGLVDVLVFHGYDVEWADTGTAGLEQASRGNFDLLLLDVMLPGMSGFEICNRIRAQDKEQAIIMLTAKSNDEDIIEGLTLGADDYVTKPFSVAQLVLRIQTVLRRSRQASEMATHLQLGEDTDIDLQNLSGRRGDDELVFTRREIAILQYLHSHRDRPVPREELLSKVWGYAHTSDIETRTIDIHIAKLRRKIEPDPAAPCYLVTVRGAGYRLVMA